MKNNEDKFTIMATLDITSSKNHVLTALPITQRNAKGFYVDIPGNNIFIPHYLSDEFKVATSPDVYTQVIANHITNSEYGDYWLPCKYKGKGSKSYNCKIEIEVLQKVAAGDTFYDKLPIARTLTIPKSLLRNAGDQLEVKAWIIRKKLREGEILPKGKWDGENIFRDAVYSWFKSLQNRVNTQQTLDDENK